MGSDSIDILALRSRHLHAVEFWYPYRSLASCHAEYQLTVRIQYTGVAWMFPWTNAGDNFPGMRHRRWWDPCTRPICPPVGGKTAGRTGGRYQQYGSMSNRSTGIYRANKVAEMVRTPEVVMTEVSDYLALCQIDARVIRSILMANVHLEIVPVNARVWYSGHHFCRLIGASIAYDQKLKVGERLIENAADRHWQHWRPVVRGDDDRHTRHSSFIVRSWSLPPAERHDLGCHRRFIWKIKRIRPLVVV